MLHSIFQSECEETAMPEKYANLFFDLDGTLTDSGEGIMNSAAYAFRSLGLPVPGVKSLRKMVGPPLSAGFGSLGMPEEMIEDAIKLYRENYHGNGGKYQNSVYPGIPEMLQNLRGNGFRLFVATSKPEGLAKDIMAHFGLDVYFEYIAGATMDHSRENKDDVLRYLIESVGSGGAVMIGDTHYDVTGAKKLGLPCIGVTWGYGDSESMLHAGALALVNSPAELSALLSA